MNKNRFRQCTWAGAMESAASLKYGGFPRCDFRGSRLTSMPSVFKVLRSNLTYLRVRFPFVHPFAKSQ